MKVLMFGWEFPPHISGGLGTACHGLTKALGNKNVEVLFVVPKLSGGETIRNGEILSASNIIIPATDLKSSRRRGINRSLHQHATLKSYVKKKQLTVLKVFSGMSPYQQISLDKPSVTIQHWNYSLPSIPENLIQEDDEDGNAIEEYPAGISYEFKGSYGTHLTDEVSKYALVARVIAAQYTFDVIHAHDWMTFPAGIEAKRVSGKPLIVHVHATEYDRAGQNGDPSVCAIERKGMHEADHIVAVSQRTKTIVVSQYGVLPQKIEVIHNGILPAGKSSANFAIPIGSCIITFLGRITYQKGPMYFVEAARKVVQQFPDAHFVLAGAGDLLPQIINRVAQLRLSNNFHFTGFIKGEQVNKIWAISDVYVMPSVSEPFGITPLEAIQAGVPVIISNQTGVSEVMPHAIKVDFWDTQALAEAICSVLKYKSLSNTLKKNSKKEIKNITWDKAATKIKTLYHELTNPTNP